MSDFTTVSSPLAVAEELNRVAAHYRDTANRCKAEWEGDAVAGAIWLEIADDFEKQAAKILRAWNRL
jgi:sulfite reductase beta subunit-like hemoprotein